MKSAYPPSIRYLLRAVGTFFFFFVGTFDMDVWISVICLTLIKIVLSMRD